MTKGFFKVATDSAKEIIFTVIDDEVSIGKPLEFSFRRRAGGTRRNCPISETVVKMIHQLNHFLKSVERNQNRENYDFLISLMMRLNWEFETSSLEQEAKQCILDSPGLDFTDEKKRIFIRLINKNIVESDRIMEIIEEYCHKSTVSKLVEPKGSQYSRLGEDDIHICHMLTVYIKLLNILFYRVVDVGKFDDVMRPTIISIANKANEYISINRFINNRIRLQTTSFMDRLYNYVVDFSERAIKYNDVLYVKFGSEGYSQDHVASNIIYDMLGSLNRITPVHFVEKDKNYEDGLDIDDYGFVSINTAAYLTGTRESKQLTLFKNKKTKHIVRVLSSMGTGEEISDAAKFEIFLDKKDRELLLEKDEIRKYILGECIDATTDETYNTISMLEKDFTPHPLSLMMVKIFTEQMYNSNIVDLLTKKEIFVICTCIYQRLVEFPSLRLAIIGQPFQNRYPKTISPEDISSSIISANQVKTCKILTDLCKEDYGIRLDNGIKSFSIREDLIKFVNRGVI